MLPSPKQVLILYSLAIIIKWCHKTNRKHVKNTMILVIKGQLNCRNKTEQSEIGHENVSENLLLFPAPKNICCSPRRYQEVYLRCHPKTSSRPSCKTSSGRVFKTRLQDQGVFKKAFCRQVFKTFWRPLETQKNCYGEDVFDTSSPKWMFTGHNRFSIFEFLKLFKDFFALHPNYYLYAENIIFPVFFQKGEQLKIVIKTTWINCKS